MKKNILFILIALAVTISLQAQEQKQLLSKKGAVILPEKGDFMLGIDSRPFFQYVGNMFNGNTNNYAPNFDFAANAPLSIYGKYMKDERTAYRVIFRLGFSNLKDVELSIIDNQSSPVDPNKTVDDIYKRSSSNIALGFGYEKNRGKGRLRGIYGAQMIFSLSTLKESWEYGNNFTSDNNSPTRTVFYNNQGSYNSWKLNDKRGTSFGIALEGFLGIEYFFAPKMSVSGEFNYGLTYQRTGERETETQAYNYLSDRAETTTSTSPGDRYFAFDTSVTGALNLNFYF